MRGEGLVLKVVSNFPLYRECPMCSRAVNVKLNDLNTRNLMARASVIRCESCKNNFPSDSYRWKFRIAMQVRPSKIAMKKHAIEFAHS